jgi:hypothetical protein
MTKPWKPNGDAAPAVGLRRRKAWPTGATAGLLLVAAACVGVAAMLYHVAGPRDVFEEDSALD